MLERSPEKNSKLQGGWATKGSTETLNQTYWGRGLSEDLIASIQSRVEDAELNAKYDEERRSREGSLGPGYVFGPEMG